MHMKAASVLRMHQDVGFGFVNAQTLRIFPCCLAIPYQLITYCMYALQKCAFAMMAVSAMMFVWCDLCMYVHNTQLLMSARRLTCVHRTSISHAV